MKNKKLLIFDADKTLRRCVVKGKKYCPTKPGEWELMPGVKEKLAHLNWGKDIFFGIATNQPGVAAHALSKKMCLELLVDLVKEITGGYLPPIEVLQFCPHKEDSSCVCRKPKPTMQIRIMKYYQVDPTHVLDIGDEDCDSEAAANAGIDFSYAKDFFGWKK